MDAHPTHSATTQVVAEETTRSTSPVLSERQRQVLRNELEGRLVAVCFGAGVDSTAMLVALHDAGLCPRLISMADTGGEKPQTMRHVEVMNRVLTRWQWPEITVCRKVPLATTGYTDLFGNCWANATLPSLAFGLKSCSVKWKQVPQEQLLKGVKSGPNQHPPHPLWLEAQHTGQRIVKLIGYDCGRADQRRSARLAVTDDDFDYCYPLQRIGWHRGDCVRAITQALGPDHVPVKSACYYCPASKRWELWWLAAHHPELLDQALQLERRALTGKHSRFDVVEFGATWEDLVREAERFPSSKTSVGLGRSFAWNHWARQNDVVDGEFVVRRDPESRARFLAMSDQLRGDDNALDARQGAGT
jgi:hypothetical protein